MRRFCREWPSGTIPTYPSATGACRAGAEARLETNHFGGAPRLDSDRRPSGYEEQPPLGFIAPNKANLSAWFNSVHPVVTVPGWDGWHRQRVPKRGVFGGVGILPMLHGLEAHATLVRSTRSGCYLELNQANLSGVPGATSAFLKRGYVEFDPRRTFTK